jgi:hypothetical protein
VSVSAPHHWPEKSFPWPRNKIIGHTPRARDCYACSWENGLQPARNTLETQAEVQAALTDEPMGPLLAAPLGK